MSYFRFADPWLFLLFFIIPWMVFNYWKSKPATFNYSGLTGLKKLNPQKLNYISHIPFILRGIAVALIIISLARPQEGRKSTEILSAGVDIMLAIDTSGSMRAMDFIKNDKQVDRLTIVKQVVNDFIEGREFDRVGMVVFGKEAFTQCPLTLDHDILFSFLDKLKIGIAGDSTAIGSAIGIATKRLKDLKSKSKVIILLTDGQNNAGKILPFQAAKIANALGIKIYTVGVGTQGKAPFMVDTPFGTQVVYQEVALDEVTLKKISQLTGGKYFRATDSDSLKKIYEQIDSLEKSEVKWIDHSEFNELFPFFLIPGIFLLLLEAILSQTQMRRIP